MTPKEKAALILSKLDDIFTELDDPVSNRDGCDEKPQKTLSAAAEKKKALKASYRLKTRFSAVCGEFVPLKNKDVEQIDAEGVFSVIGAFKTLIADINDRALFVPSKQSFAEFAGITTGQYDSLLYLSADDDIRTYMETLNSYIYDLQSNSAEQGIQKERSTSSRLKAKREGLSIEEAKPAPNNYFINNAIIKSPDDYRNALPPSAASKRQ